MIQMVPVMTQEDIVDLSELAGEIWREFFPGIITKEQVEYMLDMFLSPEALKEQIEAGTEAFFIYPTFGRAYLWDLYDGVVK